MSEPSQEAIAALRMAEDALKINQKQEGEIDAAKKLGYQAVNGLEKHEAVCAQRASQTLSKIEAVEEKIDRLVGVLFGIAKIFTTALVTAFVGLFIWLVKNGS